VSDDRFPPGPRRQLPGAMIIALNRDLPGTFRALARRYGDVAGFQAGPFRVALLSHPDDIREALVVRHRELVRSDLLRYLRVILGNGLLTSDGDVHRRHRRMLQPIFHHERIPGYGDVAVEYAERVTATWRDGDVVDVAEEMDRLTLLATGRALMDVDLEGDARAVGEAVPAALKTANRVINPLAPLLDRLPLHSTRGFRAAHLGLHQLVLDLIARRRAEGTDRGDLLSLVLAARDSDDGRGLTDREVRDEVLTMLMTGHETVAAALVWTWYLLARHPTVEALLHSEVKGLLRGRLPSSADLPDLSFTKQVVAEAMRLYPPAPMVIRETTGDYRVGRYVLPARCVIMMCSAVTHHDPRFYPEPERFAPERWTAEFRAGLHRFAYFPFGGGPHQCIGEPLAWTECVLVVATIAARWRLRLQPGTRVVPRTRVTLRPRGGLRLRLERHA
jgi:cytochrome P450